MNYEKGIPEFNSADSIPYASADISKSVYRSIDVARNDAHDVFATKESHYGKFGGSVFNVSELVTPFSKNKQDVDIQVTSSISSCPERPYHLSRTHFVVDAGKMSEVTGLSRLDQILMPINVCLNNFSEYDFSYFQSDFMWKGKYLQGSSSCEIDIHLYSAGSEDPASIIVEAKKTEGDSKPFLAFYRQFHSEVLNIEDTRPAPMGFMGRLPANPVTPASFLTGITPIFNMAKESYFEPRLEASKMLCDLAQHREPALLQLVECRDQVIHSLESMVDDSFDAVKQHSMCALAAFVQTPGYAESLVSKSNTLRVLFQAVVTTPSEPAYETIQSRRECARVLCAVAKCDAVAVMTALRLGGVNINELSPQRIEAVVDARLKMLSANLFELFRAGSNKM